ncbi:LL-diaminopimelate aminotransferase [Aeribacillus alveayuensis]|uniref:Aminotransferase n=1 Tax=Aeribacillus alveayuensis TaxID=279215 RepID=A0ABT9VP19_9BACI|nr:aspartate/methionine/tyrosine aminotransferase [Bacillus alveayuensis]
MIASQRLNRFDQLIFSELAQYKYKKIEEGKDIIDLSIGSPDQPPPSFIQQTMIEEITKKDAFQYSLTGLPEFHTAVSQFYQRRYDVDICPETEVLQTMGSQDALMHLPLAFMDEGDIVLLPDPGYTAYEAAFHIVGASIYSMPLLEENGYLPDLDNISPSIAQKAKMMVLNFPGNPVPALSTKSFFEKVVAFAKKYEIIVIHDFAYSELIFDQQKPISFLSIKGAKEVGLECNSLSKSFNMAGSRIGYIVGNKKLLRHFMKLKSNLDYGVFSPIQRAAIQALLKGDTFLEANKNLYEERRNVLVNGLKNIGWDVALPPATMFVWAKIPEGYTSTEFVYQLIDQTGVVVTPGNAFGQYGEGYVRIALVQPLERLQEAIKRIAESHVIPMINNR